MPVDVGDGALPLECADMSALWNEATGRLEKKAATCRRTPNFRASREPQLEARLHDVRT